jgi:hypothetical protein
VYAAKRFSCGLGAKQCPINLVYDVKIIPEVQEGREKETYWKKCGVGFPNKDGSFNFKLDLFPAVTFNVKERP